MAYCINCGAQIPDNSKFCKECGASQNEMSASSDSTNDSTYMQAAQPQIQIVQVPVQPVEDICPPEERTQTGLSEAIVGHCLTGLMLFLQITTHSWIFFVLAVLLFIYASSCKYHRNYCTNCNWRKAPNANSCPHCGNREKPIIPFWLTIVLIPSYAIAYFIMFTIYVSWIVNVAAQSVG